MARLFGTDGIRGLANTDYLTPEKAVAFGRAMGVKFGLGQSAPIYIGRDTRISGPLLEGSVAAGIASVGVDVHLLGVLPTPAIALKTREEKAAAGLVISASHNSFEDNGLKIFQSSGLKCDDQIEDELSELILNPDMLQHRAVGEKLGRIQGDCTGSVETEIAQKYVDYALKRYGRGLSLAGLKIVVDTAYGAAHFTTPQILKELGAEVILLNPGEPSGVNINAKCGSTHPEQMQAAVQMNLAHLGLAHDGDADRLICCDEAGELVDGDDLLALFATQWLRGGKLNHKTVAATVMSNFGLDECVQQAGGTVIRAGVGDRYVLEKMISMGLNLGGEQSGHMILWDDNTTGDGLVAGLELLRIMRETGQPLGKLRQVLRKYPQSLLNLKVPKKVAFEEIPGLTETLAALEQELSGRGRVMVRYSGTEAKVRILVETKEESDLKRVSAQAAEPFRKYFGI